MSQAIKGCISIFIPNPVQLFLDNDWAAGNITWTSDVSKTGRTEGGV